MFQYSKFKSPWQDAADSDLAVYWNLTGDGFYSTYLKRPLDVAIVLLALPFVIILLLPLSLAVMLDGGPAFFIQERVGRGGRNFRMWKLRTMAPDAEQRLASYLAENPEAKTEWDAAQKLKNDPRITRLGSFLRRTSLDELPQLWNVLRGDMSLVGPRPMMPCQRDLYPSETYYRLRPGLTGLWQVSDRNETSFAERAVFDTAYAERLSLLADAMILARTVRPVLYGTGY